MFSPAVEHAPLLAMIALLGLVAFARRRRLPVTSDARRIGRSDRPNRCGR